MHFVRRDRRGWARRGNLNQTQRIHMLQRSVEFARWRVVLGLWDTYENRSATASCGNWWDSWQWPVALRARGRRRKPVPRLCLSVQHAPLPRVWAPRVEVAVAAYTAVPVDFALVTWRPGAQSTGSDRQELEDNSSVENGSL